MTIFWFVVVVGVLVFVHELGHFIFARLMNVRVLKFSLGFGPKLIGKKMGDTEYLISAVPLGGYVKMLGEDIEEKLKEEDMPYAYNYKSAWQKALIVFAGPAFNFLLAYIIFFGVLSIGLPINIPTMKAIMPVVEEIDPDSPAERAGLKEGDFVVSINDYSLSTWTEMTEIIMKSPEKEITVKILRNSEDITLNIIPKAVEIKDRKGNIHKIGRIGIKKKDVVKTVSGGLAVAPINALKAIYHWSALVVESIAKLVTGEVSLKHIGGPILIGKMSGEAAAVGVLALLMFISIISVNLAMLNLLPIPVLDGGHLLFLSIEAIRGKPMSEKVIVLAHRIGMAALLALMALAIYNDIFRLLDGKPTP